MGRRKNHVIGYLKGLREADKRIVESAGYKIVDSPGIKLAKAVEKELRDFTAARQISRQAAINAAVGAMEPLDEALTAFHASVGLNKR